MLTDINVIYHTGQAETSHSQKLLHCDIVSAMSEGESTIFIRTLIEAVDADPDLNDAALSVKAGLSRRAVTDLREGRVKSPKLSTVFKLARALNRDPGEMMGLGPRPKLQRDLTARLEKYSEGEQARLLEALPLLNLRDS